MDKLHGIMHVKLRWICKITKESLHIVENGLQEGENGWTKTKEAVGQSIGTLCC